MGICILGQSPPAFTVPPGRAPECSSQTPNTSGDVGVVSPDDATQPSCPDDLDMPWAKLVAGSSGLAPPLPGSAPSVDNTAAARVSTVSTVFKVPESSHVGETYSPPECGKTMPELNAADVENLSDAGFVAEAPVTAPQTGSLPTLQTMPGGTTGSSPQKRSW